MIATVIADTGPGIFANVGRYMVTVILGLAVHALITLPLLLKFMGGVSPRAYVGKLAPALASVFAGYPIHVPPIRDRKQAVLRWAHQYPDLTEWTDNARLLERLTKHELLPDGAAAQLWNAYQVYRGVVHRRALQELGRFAFPNGPPPCPRSRPGKAHRER